MGGDDDVARQHVAFGLHNGQLQRAAHRRHGAIGVGDHADARRARADAAQAADNAERRRAAAAGFALRARNIDANEIGAPFRPADAFKAGVHAGKSGKKIHHLLTVDQCAVE